MAIGGNSGGGGKASSNAIKAGEAFYEISADDSKLKQTLNNVADRLKKTASIMRGVGIGAMVAGTAVLAPLLALFKEAAERADSIQDVADRMNASTEAVSKLGYAAEFSAASLGDIERGNALLTKSALAAQKGTEAQAKAFEKIGISAEQFLDMDVDERFLAIAEAYDAAGSEAEKSALLFSIFGKSAIALRPLFQNGAEGLREWFNEAEKVGAVINRDDAQKAAKTMDAYDRSIKSIKYTLLEVGMSFLGFSGSIEEGSQAFASILKGIREFVKENRQAIAIIAAIAAGVIALGAALTAIGFIIPALVTGITTLTTVGVAVIGFVFSPLALKIAIITAAVVVLTAIVVGLTYAFLKLTGVGAILGEMFSGLWDTFKTTIGGILAAMMKGDFKLAGDIAMVGLQVAISQGILTLTKLWNKFKANFVDGWHASIMFVKMAFVGFFDSIKLALVRTLTFIIEQFQKVARAVGGEDILKNMGIDTGEMLNRLRGEEAKIEQTLKDKMQPIRDEFDKEQRVRDESRKKDEQAAEDELNKFRMLLEHMTAQANAREERQKKEREDMGMRPDIIADKLATAVRGTFRSADYRGALAIGPANPEMKKQTKLLEGIDDKLGNIEQNIGMEFE